jgi:hypothetical protein
VTNRPTNQDLERIAKLSSDYLAALRAMPEISTLAARNLVLDIYASEREFIRTFQGLIDAGLNEPTAKSWHLALHCKHDWGYKSMSSKVIKNFDDGWQSNNLLLATRVMQCIGEWKKLPIDPVWDSRITDYIKLHDASPCIKVSNRTSEISKNFLNAYDDQLNRAKTCSDKNSKASANPRSFGANVTKKTQKAQSNNDGIMGFIYFFIVCLVWIPPSKLIGVIASFTEKPLVSLNKIDATKEVKIRLASYYYDLAKARLVCELDEVTKQFKSLEQEALASYAPEAANLVKPGLAKTLQRISLLKQHGKEPYWEDCSTGVGYQKYDRYTWIQGESFYGSLFAVAKRKCAKPAIQIITYADAGHTKVLYKQWIHFKPDPYTGVASSIKFIVPMKMLPSGYQTRIWNHPTDVSCN